MRALLLLAASGLIVLATSVGASADLIIDNFSSTTMFDLMVSAGHPAPASQTDPYNATTNPLALGGSRTETLTLTHGDPFNPNAGRGEAMHWGPLGVDFTNAANVSSNLTLAYSFATTDFTAGGANLIRVAFGGPDYYGTHIITVIDSAGHSGQQMLQTNAGEWSLDFSYSNFSGTVNFAALTGVTYEIDSSLSSDHAISSLVATVPEPATMGLVALGLSALMARRRSAK